jgi:hypothetical protein
MLEGQVEVGDDAGGAREHLEQAGAGLGGLQVRDADPVQARHAGEVGQQALQQAQVAEVLAVRGGVLADQQHLADAAFGEPGGLVEDLLRGDGRRTSRGRRGWRRSCSAGRSRRRSSTATTGRPSSRRRTTRGPLAGGQPLRQIHRLPVAGQGDRRGGRAAGASGSSVRRSLRHVGRRRRGHPVPPPGAREIGVAVEAEHGVGLGQLVGELAAVPLGQASRPATTACVRAPPSSRRSAASSRTSMESFFACSTKPQVLTTATSASAASSTSRQPGRLEPPGELLGVDLVALRTPASPGRRCGPVRGPPR